MTERLARISAGRPLVTIAVWIIVALIGMGLSGQLLSSAFTTELKLGSGFESQRAEQLLEDRMRGPKPITEMVIVQSESLTVDNPAFQARVTSLTGQIQSLGDDVVEQVVNFYELSQVNPLQAAVLVSQDRRTALVPVIMTGDLQDAEDNVHYLLDLAKEENGKDGFRVLTVGDSSISLERNELSERDLQQGERVGIPVALIILVLLFGAVVAALVPISLSLVCVVAALGIAAVIGQFYELVFFVQLMIIMIGLAVGIDYSLIIISRFREELGRGLSAFDATVKAGATAGRTVLFSGATVVVALCGMFVVPFGFFQSLAIGAILVVIIAVAASLTLLPAVIALMGTRINTLSIPRFGRSESGARPNHEGGFWDRITHIVMRNPLLSVVLVGVPMLVATYFYFDIETGLNGVDVFPEEAETREAFFVMEEEFSFGLINPTEVVIDGDLTDPSVTGAIQQLQGALLADPTFPLPTLLEPNPANDLGLLRVVIPGEPASHAAVDAVNTIRETHIPAAFDGVDAEVLVGGNSAVAAEVFDVVARYTPIVFAFVLGVSFLILMLVFRSIVIPIKAVFMNLLSVGTAYGLLVLVFQKGYGRDLLGFQEAAVIDVWIPLFLFSILFGLSMDYHVFLLSRIRERFDQTGDNREAVAFGLRETAGLITGAALIMVAVFGAFASGQTIINQQVGFGLSVAILLDATLVRSVLVPATMEMLGARNWYLPKFLRWLPDVRVEPVEEHSAPA